VAADASPMKILFIMRHSGYVRNFESTLRMLCDRGHHVHLAFQTAMRHWLVDATDIPQQLAADYPNFTSSMAPVRHDGWGILGRELRLGLDYLRYLDPRYRQATKLRRRAAENVDPMVLDLAGRGAGTRAWLGRTLRLLDRSIPRSEEIDEFIDHHRPDLLLVTPFVERGSPQSDYVRSARARGIRTVLCVASWDNLTNKGLIHDQFDLITVWNEAMKREAVELHGVAAHRVVVTGAQPFDHWFERRAATPRDVFCARIGLRPDRPYLLYLCSSKFIAPDEAPFVERWVRQLRASSAALREVGVLVRPHPQNAEQWAPFTAPDLTNFVVFPSAGAAPVDEGTRADYFDSIYHSAAVVGVNTTAEIEAAIIGRAVYSYLAPEFRETQGGTLHFQYLSHNGQGLVHVAGDAAEHFAQLDAAVRGDTPQADTDRLRAFVSSFVRPHGVDVSATARLVEALERLGTTAAGFRMPAAPWAPLVRPLLRRLAAVARRKQLDAQAEKARRTKAREETRRRRAHERELRRREKQQTRAAKPPKTAAAVRTSPPAVADPPVPVTDATAASPDRASTWDFQRDASPAAEPSQADRRKQPRLPAMIGDFQRLSHADRVRFLRDNLEFMPPELATKLARNERLDYVGAEILIHVSTKSEGKRLRACAKEPFTVQWIERMIAAGEVLYDIGANVGTYSLIAAKKPSGPATVIAFEASLANAAALSANVVLNHATAHITPLAVGLSNTTGLGHFHLRELESGSAKHSLDAESADGPTLYSQPMLMYRLDDLVELLKLPPPNHIKLDVDGGEISVLDGASRTLEVPELRSVLVEVSAELSEAVAQKVEAKGLRLRHRINVKSKSGEYRVWYGLFARAGEELFPFDISAHPALALVDPVASRS